MKSILGPMRLPFLVLTPACVFLSIACAVYLKGFENVSVWHSILILLGAVFAHMSVNGLNEYFDFKSGLDFKTNPTPFSGGSGTLPNRPGLASATLIISLVLALLSGCIGLYFLIQVGWALLPVGLIGLLLVLFYTPCVTRHAVLSLIAPGLGFGPIMITASCFILTGEYAWPVFFISLVPFFFVNNLLLLNQFPDIEADKAVGRKNLPILLGTHKAAIVYGLFFGLGFLSLLLGILYFKVPNMALLGAITLPVAVYGFVGVLKHHKDNNKLLPFMALNVAMNILTPVLIGVGLLMA